MHACGWTVLVQSIPVKWTRRRSSLLNNNLQWSVPQRTTTIICRQWERKSHGTPVRLDLLSAQHSRMQLEPSRSTILSAWERDSVAAVLHKLILRRAISIPECAAAGWFILSARERCLRESRGANALGRELWAGKGTESYFSTYSSDGASSKWINSIGAAYKFHSVAR